MDTLKCESNIMLCPDIYDFGHYPTTNPMYVLHHNFRTFFSHLLVKEEMSCLDLVVLRE
jgi:hypothetical protein